MVLRFHFERLDIHFQKASFSSSSISLINYLGFRMAENNYIKIIKNVQNSGTSNLIVPPKGEHGPVIKLRPEEIAEYERKNKNKS